jgi:septum formation inhibitor MinC
VNSLPKVSTKKGLQEAFEDIIRRKGPQTSRSIVDNLRMEYTVTRVQIDSDRAGQYLIRNPNIIILGDVHQGGKVHLYGLRDVDYSVKILERMVVEDA